MSSVLEKVRRFIDENTMLEGSPCIVVAVSGGADSVALVDILLQLQRRFDSFDEASRGFRLHVAHLNHKLRGRESNDDAKFVRELARRLELDCTIGAADVQAESVSSRRGIEETAREVRYKFLASVAAERGCNRIATGHTMTDQAETFLMRLVRGAGMRGLASMRPISRLPVALPDVESNGPASEPPLLIRPLLCLTREEVESYCRERGLEFRSDLSNLSTYYTRNRVRSEVLPALKKLNPRVVQSIARASGTIAGDQDALDFLAQSQLYLARRSPAADESSESQGERHRASVYDAAALRNQPRALRMRMIIEAVKRQRTDGGAQVDAVHVRAIERLLDPQASGKHVELTGGIEVWRDFDTMVFKSSAAPHEAPSEYRLEFDGASLFVQPAALNLSIERVDSYSSARQLAIRAREVNGRDWMLAAVDAAKLPERMIVRPRRAGEQARVSGRRKTIKLKNLMIDHRIPSSLRALWPIVTTPDDRYVWSPGLPPSEEFAASDETHALAILRASSA